MEKLKQPLVYTEKEKCKVCYTCVRECPAKAIKIEKGQAEVIESRCIGCGNCVLVCSQNAKKIRDSKLTVKNILESDTPSIAMIAPSFPAEFTEIADHRILVTMIRKLGFSNVVEVSFGADLTAIDYFKTKSSDKGYFISSTCPAIVKYIEKYHPVLTDYLAGTVSPMIAMSRVVKEEYGSDRPVIFIGPCLAKKDEAELFGNNEIDAVLTFSELRDLFAEKGIFPSDEISEFDPPEGGKGSILPVSGGLLETVIAYEDIGDDNVIVAEGRNDFPEAVKEFESGILKGNHLDLLCCNGCIMGAGMSKEGKRYERMAKVRSYVSRKKDKKLLEEHRKYLEKYKDIDLSREFKPDDQRILIESDESKIKAVLSSMGKNRPEDELNCAACGYDSCREHAIAILKGLAESEMCLPYTIEQMHNYIGILAETNEKLSSAKDALAKSEKLATMGQLAAGIAHEVNNPLGVVLMYANLLMEENEGSSELHKDLKMIASQADRCKNILSGLLNFARKNEVKIKSIDVADLTDQILDSVFIPPGVNLAVSHEYPHRTLNLDPDQMIQVFSNLIKNSIEAMRSAGNIEFSTKFSGNEIIFTVKDDGPGIPEEHRSKLFEPFFTTKEIGKGTGLGLAVSYGIVKMHRGNIRAESNSDPDEGPTGTSFIVNIPIK